MITLTYVVPGNLPGAPPPGQYRDQIARFAETYVRFPADHPHSLVLIDSNGGLTPEIAAVFSAIPHRVLRYSGPGWDIGAHLFAALSMDANDWIMCFSTSAYFQRRGWLKAFVDARDEKGDGLYGSMSSFERLPHIRTTGFFVRCGRLHQYPHGCSSREEAMAFESGSDSLAQWGLRQGLDVWLVTPDVTVPLRESRTPPNIFRAGDQSNIWVCDRHVDLFNEATPAWKEIMTLGALNQRVPKLPPWQRRARRISAALRRLTGSARATDD